MFLVPVVLAFVTPAQWLIATEIAPLPRALAIPEARFRPLALVRARAVKVADRAEKGPVATFAIDHVYAIDYEPGREPIRRGRTFEVSARYRCPGGMVLTVDVPLREGEEGIWSLREDKPGQLVAYVWDTWGDRPISARKIIDPDPEDKDRPSGPRPERARRVSYRAVRHWAEAVERVEGSAGPGRLALLKEYARSPEPLIAAWAIRQLADSQAAGGLAFLRELAAKHDLPIVGQVVLDEVLATRPGAAWLGSRERRALLESWVSGEIGSDDDARRVARRFGAALRTHELDLPTTVRLMGTWEINQPMSDLLNGFTWELWGTGDGILLNDENKPTTMRILFELAVGQLREAKRGGTKVGAAQLLAQLAPFSKEQTATVRSLLRASKDPEVIQALQGALDVTARSKGMQ